MLGQAKLLAAVGAVGEDRLQEGKQPARLAVQDQQGAVTIAVWRGGLPPGEAPKN